MASRPSTGTPTDPNRPSDWAESAAWAERGVFFDGIPIVRSPPAEPVQPEPASGPALHPAGPGPGRWWWTLPVLAVALVVVL